MAPTFLAVAFKRIHRRHLFRFAFALAAVWLAFGSQDTAAAAPEIASFAATSSGELTPGFVTDKGAIPLTSGVPVVFHSNGSQASEYPAGFTTVAGPFSGPMFDSVTMIFAAHNSAPASVDLRFEIRNGTTGELITELPAAAPDISVSNIPLDTNASPGDPAGDHCEDQFETAGTTFQITLAPPVNSVFVGPTDDLQLIITPTGTFGGDVELCVDSSFYTAMGLVVEPVPVPNEPPVAALSAPATVEATSPAGASVILDASASSDPDGDPLNFEFSGPFGTINNGSDPTLEVALPFAPPSLTSSVSVTVSDPDDETDTASTSVTVQDTTPPSITAPPDISVKADESCAASVADLGTPSTSDAASPPVSVVNDAPAVFPLGTTIVTWTATDASGNSASVTQSVTVEDTTAPTLTLSVDPGVLWPPNHKLFDVLVTATVTDNCGAGDAILSSVTSDEPDNGLGDGDKPDDIQGADIGTADYELQLRAERAGGGDGRVYTITYTATDSSGNTTTDAVTVEVPRDRR